MSDMTTEWTNVWQAIEDRRIALGWSKETLYERTGTSDGTYRKMRAGVEIARPDKRVAVAKALGWSADSIDRLLRGEPAVLTATEPATPVDTTAVALAEIRAHLEELQAQVADLQSRRPKQRSLRRVDTPAP